jgi:hypothetical protein
MSALQYDDQHSKPGKSTWLNVTTQDYHPEMNLPITEKERAGSSFGCLVIRWHYFGTPSFEKLYEPWTSNENNGNVLMYDVPHNIQSNLELKGYIQLLRARS